jgi:hypothetical protein
VNNDDFSEAESFALSLEEVADLVQVVQYACLAEMMVWDASLLGSFCRVRRLVLGISCCR